MVQVSQKIASSGRGVHLSELKRLSRVYTHCIFSFNQQVERISASTTLVWTPPPALLYFDPPVRHTPDELARFGCELCRDRCPKRSTVQPVCPVNAVYPPVGRTFWWLRQRGRKHQHSVRPYENIHSCWSTIFSTIIWTYMQHQSLYSVRQINYWLFYIVKFIATHRFGFIFQHLSLFYSINYSLWIYFFLCLC